MEQKLYLIEIEWNLLYGFMELPSIGNELNRGEIDSRSKKEKLGGKCYKWKRY